MSKSKTILLSAFLCVASGNLLAYHPYDQRIMSECLLNQRFAYPSAQCNDVFHYYPASPSVPQSEAKDGLKIGSFNIYLLGSGESRFKDLKAIAQIMEQWDVVGVSELLNWTGIDNTYNQKLLKAQGSLIAPLAPPEDSSVPLSTPIESLYEHADLEMLNNDPITLLVGTTAVASNYLESVDFMKMFSIVDDDDNFQLLEDSGASDNSDVKLEAAPAIFAMANSATTLSDTDLKKMKAYWSPGYMRLLAQLQALDPEAGWALVLSPYIQSENFELAGFFFKTSRVSLLETQECKSHSERIKKEGAPREFGTKVDETEWAPAILPDTFLGCVARFPREVENKFSRRPFMASFDFKGSPFTMLTGHYRFRPGDTVSVAGRPKCLDDCQKNLKEILDFFHPQGAALPYLAPGEMATAIKLLKDGGMPTDKDKKNARLMKALSFSVEMLEERQMYTDSEEEIARYYETYQTLGLIRTMSSQGPYKDVILGADFNLEFEDKGYWDLVLLPMNPNGPAQFYQLSKKMSEQRALQVIAQENPTQFELAVNEKSSIGIQGPNSAYDHFVVPVGRFANCRGENGQLRGRLINFTSPELRIESNKFSGTIMDLLSSYQVADDQVIQSQIDQLNEDFFSRNIIEKNQFETCGSVEKCRVDVAEDNEKIRSRVYDNRCDSVKAALEACQAQSVADGSSKPSDCLEEKSGVQWCEAQEGQAYTPKFFMQVLSDHMPIELSCAAL